VAYELLLLLRSRLLIQFGSLVNYLLQKFFPFFRTCDHGRPIWHVPEFALSVGLSHFGEGGVGTPRAGLNAAIAARQTTFCQASACVLAGPVAAESATVEIHPPRSAPASKICQQQNLVVALLEQLCLVSWAIHKQLCQAGIQFGFFVATIVGPLVGGHHGLISSQTTFYLPCAVKR
jgi:hypothetical protein